MRKKRNYKRKAYKAKKKRLFKSAGINMSRGGIRL